MKQVAKNTERSAREGLLLILPLAAGCGLFYAVPFLMVLQNSFQRGTGRSREYVGIETYRNTLLCSMLR